MLSSSKTRTTSSKKISRLSHFDPMRDHEASSFYINFNTDLIADEFKSSCKSHRWSSKSKFHTDISNLTPSEILDLPLSNFGLCNISSINQFMEELDISSLKQHAVNELFKIKYATKMYPHDVNEDIMRDISKTKLNRIKKHEQIKSVKDKVWEKKWGDRFKAAEYGISTDPSAATTTALADEIYELNLEARLAKLRTGTGSRLTKRQKGIKRRGTKRQKGTKRRTRSRR